MHFRRKKTEKKKETNTHQKPSIGFFPLNPTSDYSVDPMEVDEMATQEPKVDNKSISLEDFQDALHSLPQNMSPTGLEILRPNKETLKELQEAPTPTSFMSRKSSFST